jgi:hypothetical protein
MELEIDNLEGTSGTHDDRLARRIADLSASDSQFAAAEPIAEVFDAARRPGLRLPQIIETLVAGYADRPALGQRARELVTDRATGRTSTRLLPSFDTITYGDLWERVRAIASAWRHDPQHPLSPGEWLARFETALKALPEKQRQMSVLPLLGFYRDPQQPLLGAPAPTEVFRTAVRVAVLGADGDIPHISAELIDKYATDLHHLRLL